MTTEALTYRIAYNRLDHDYTCYVTIDDVEQTIGSRPDHAAAEAHCRAYLYDHYADNHTPEVAARIAVEMSEEDLPNGLMRMPEGDILDTGGMRVTFPKASPGGA